MSLNYILQVKIWFQNRRSKCKKIMKQGPGTVGAQPPGTLDPTLGGPQGMSPGAPSPPHPATPTPQAPTPQQNGQPNGQPPHGGNMLPPPPSSSVSPPSTWTDMTPLSSSVSSAPPTHSSPYMSQYSWYSQAPLVPQQHSLLT